MSFDIRQKVLKKYIEEPGITRITIPDDVIDIGINAFADCESIVEVTLPYGVILINDCAFSNCTSLRKINLPLSLKMIGEDAFEGCTSLRKVELPASLYTICENSFEPGVEFYYGGLRITPDIEVDYGISFIRALRDCNLKGEFYEETIGDMFCSLFKVNPGNKLLLSNLNSIQDFIVPYAIEYGVYEIIEKFCSNSGNSVLTSDNIDDYIQLAIDEKQHEIYLLLLEYKRKYIGYRKRDWSL